MAVGCSQRCLGSCLQGHCWAGDRGRRCAQPVTNGQKEGGSSQHFFLYIWAGVLAYISWQRNISVHFLSCHPLFPSLLINIYYVNYLLGTYVRVERALSGDPLLVNLTGLHIYYKPNWSFSCHWKPVLPQACAGSYFQLIPSLLSTVLLPPPPSWPRSLLLLGF